MSTKIFWALLIVDTCGLAVLAYLASRGPSSPEGPVGGWLIFIPPILLLILTALVLVTRSEAVKMAGIYILGVPWVMIIVGPVYSPVQSYLTDRRIAGDDSFPSGPLRKLAHAIQARDAALAKSLIPLAGDLNRPHGDQTLLLFAVDNAVDTTQTDWPVPAASLEIVQALLQAGANADQKAPTMQRWPLGSCLRYGPELTLLLLKAGANPNHLDDANRPLWWNVLSDDTDRGVRTLEVLLDNGADVTIRDREGGPIGWAAYHARASYASSWRAVWLLIEHGAAWKDEQEFGQPVVAMLARDLEERKSSGRAMSDEMRKVLAKYGLD